MKDIVCKVISNEKVSFDGYKLVLESAELPALKGGQFAMIKLARTDLILRRPFGIATADKNTITFVYQIKGEGTTALSKTQAGEFLKVALPLGNGFDLGDAKNVVIVGGGYGVIPLLLTAEQHRDRNLYIYNGFAGKENIMLEDEFNSTGKQTICTVDGSYGTKGFPTDVMSSELEKTKPDVIITCGPTPLMKQVKLIGESKGIKTLVSLEQRMGCGIGACLVCTCKVGGENKRVCASGPVFDSREVEL